MVSGIIQSFPVDQIRINENRQRKDLGDIESLARSLATDGQINPVVITPDYILVAGERRLTAAKLLGWSHILTHFTTDLSPQQLYKLELEENVRRLDLAWKEKCLAIADYHELMVSENPDWAKVDTGNALSYSENYIYTNLAVAAAIREGNEAVINAPKFSVARGLVTRSIERAKATQLDLLETAAAKTAPKPQVSAPIVFDIPKIEIIEEPQPTILNNMDFIEWLKQPELPKFNFIHCDFPYGINYSSFVGGAADTFGGYEDSPETYRKLLSAFCENLDRFTQNSAHILFWFSMHYYQETVDAFTKAGLAVNLFPLIWFKSNNAGILPDPKRGPRRNYETALLLTKGDRPIVRAVSNVAAVPDKKEIHTSEKPKDMLRHFFSMLVDQHSIVFDPTAGSANALVVARELGAASIYGLEINQEYYQRAMENLK